MAAELTKGRASAKRVAVALAGDVMIDRADASSMLSHVAPILGKADLAICNLEGPMCDDGQRHPGKAGVSLHVRSRPNAVAALTGAGINMVSLANNHALDYGLEGLQQTVGLLDGAHIAYAGAGRNRSEARRAAFLTKNDVRIALLSYTSVCVPAFVATDTQPGVAAVRISTTYSPNMRLLQQPGSPMTTRTCGEPADVADLLKDVRAAKTAADVVLVAWHWGVSERWGKLADYQQTLGRAVIDAGASAIIGHHAHMLLGIEFYQRCPIFYSLGNFAFDLEHPYFHRESVIVQCDISTRGVDEVRLIPVFINDKHEPVPLRADDVNGQRLTWMLECASEGLNTKYAGRGAHIEVTADE